MDAPQRYDEHCGSRDADILAVEQVVRGPGAHPDDLLVVVAVGLVRLVRQRSHPLPVQLDEHHLFFEPGRLASTLARRLLASVNGRLIPSTPKSVRRPAFSLAPQRAPAGSTEPKPAAFQALTPPRRALEFGNPSRMFLAA